MLTEFAEDTTPLRAVWKVAGDQRSLVVSGELDIATAPLLDEALEAEVGPGSRVAFDLAGLDFIDASGVRVLVRLRRTVGTTGRVVLQQPSSRVLRVLALAGFDGDQ